MEEAVKGKEPCCGLVVVAGILVLESGSRVDLMGTQERRKTAKRNRALQPHQMSHRTDTLWFTVTWCPTESVTQTELV